MNKAELKEQILASRQELQSAMARVGDERAELVILHGEWSLKDLIGHLGFWEENVAKLYETLAAGQQVPALEDMDALNAQAINDWGARSLDVVRRDEEAAYQRVMALVDAAAEANLFDPAFFPWTEGRPFAEFISDNTCGHYEEHLPEVIAWLKRIA
jgi:hypothetical protein